MSDSVQPHRQQPTRLRRPWDFPGKSTGVGCHCLLLLMSSMYQSHKSLCGRVTSYTSAILDVRASCILIVSLAQVPGTHWMPNACLLNETMKTEKTIRNLQRAVSGGEQIMGHTKSEDGDLQGQKILIVSGERGSSGTGCLPALLLQPAQTLRPWPGNT